MTSIKNYTVYIDIYTKEVSICVYIIIHSYVHVYVYIYIVIKDTGIGIRADKFLYSYY